MANPTKSATLRRSDSGMGVHETGTNHTKFNVWFYGSNVSAPWCAIFVCWVLIGVGFRFRKNASAHGLGAYLISIGWTRISSSNIDSGDVVVYHISHIGLCKARLSGNRKRVYEGNHGNKSCLVDRDSSEIAYGVRPPYSSETIFNPAPTTPPESRHTKYIVHGNANHDTGRLTDSIGWTTRYPSPAVGSIVYPASDLEGGDFSDCNGNVWTPIEWPGTNSIGQPNNGWYRKDYLQWAN